MKAYRKYRYSSTLSLTSVLDRGGWLTRSSGHFNPRITWYPLHGKLGEPQGRSGQVQKISPPLGFDPQTHKACSKSLYRLSYPRSHSNITTNHKHQPSMVEHVWSHKITSTLNYWTACLVATQLGVTHVHSFYWRNMNTTLMQGAHSTNNYVTQLLLCQTLTHHPSNMCVCVYIYIYIHTHTHTHNFRTQHNPQTQQTHLRA